MHRMHQLLITATVLMGANSWALAEPSLQITPVSTAPATIELNGDQSADIQLGSSLVVTSKTRILSVRLFHPNVLTVEAFGAKAVRILSKTAGTSPVVIREEGGAESKLDVRVFSESLNTLDALLRRLYPDTKLVLHEVGASLLVRGDVESTNQAEQILEIGKQFYPEVLDQLRRKGDASKAGGEQQDPIPRQLTEGQPRPATLHDEIQQLRKDVQRLVQILERREQSASRKVALDRVKPAVVTPPNYVTQVVATPARPTGPTDGPRLIGVTPDGEPTIDGRTFEDWQRVVEYEPSAKALVPAIQAMVSLGRRDHADETAESLFDLFSRFPIYGDGNEELYPGLEDMMKQAAASFAGIPTSKTDKFIAAKLRSESAQDIMNALMFYFYSIEVQTDDLDEFEIPAVIRDALIDVWTTKPSLKFEVDLASVLLGYCFPKHNAKADAKLVEWLWNYRERSIKNGWPDKGARMMTASLLLKHDPQDEDVISDVLDELSRDLSSKSVSVPMYRVAVQIGAGLTPHIPKLIEQFQKTATSSSSAVANTLQGKAGRVSLTFSHRICLVELLGNLGPKAKDAVPHIEAALAKTNVEAWNLPQSIDELLSQSPQLLVTVEDLNSFSQALPPQASPTHGVQPAPIGESTQFVLSALQALHRITGEKPDTDVLKPKPAATPAN